MNQYRAQLNHEAFGHIHLPGFTGTQGDYFAHCHRTQLLSPDNLLATNFALAEMRERLGVKND